MSDSASDSVPFVPPYVASRVRGNTAALYIINLVSFLALGLHIFMFTQSYLLYMRSPRDKKKSRKIYIILSFIMFALFLTSTIISGWEFGGLVLRRVELTEYVIGHLQYVIPWWSILNQITVVLVIYLADGVLLWRCWIVWQNLYVMALPILMYSGVVCLGVMRVVTETLPIGSEFSIKHALNFVLAYTFISGSLNILLTTLIAVKVIQVREGANSVLSAQAKQRYNGVIAVVVESAVPYALLGIATMVTVRLKGSARTTFLRAFFDNLWYISATLSLQFIVHRISMDQSWTKTMDVTADTRLSRPIRFGRTDSQKSSESGSGDVEGGSRSRY